MKLRDTLIKAFFALTCLASYTTAARKQPANSVLLSTVKTLTLRDGKPTTARRLSAIPQLTCIGGNARGLYDVDVMRCTNSGADYDEDDVQWTCKASLPPEFRLGSTDVMCEGYDSPEDPYILKGSCGVEYRLVLTDAGEKKYGHREDQGDVHQSSGSEKLIFGLFVAFIFSVIGYGIWQSCTGRAHHGPPGRGRGGGGGGGGGRWGGGDDDNDDPPPPYTRQVPPRGKSANTTANAGWRPGVWTGAAAAAGAGYMLGNRNATRRNDDPMVGSSRGAAQRGNGGGYGGGGSSSATPSSSRYDSTGFGGTQRR